MHTCCTEIILHCVSVSNQLQQLTDFCTNFSPKSGGSGGRVPPVEKSGGTPSPASPPHYTRGLLSLAHVDNATIVTRLQRIFYAQREPGKRRRPRTSESFSAASNRCSLLLLTPHVLWSAMGAPLSPAKTVEQIEMPFCGRLPKETCRPIVWECTSVPTGEYDCEPCAVAMRLCVKLLLSTC